jgi:AraC-like DNA-binding protein
MIAQTDRICSLFGLDQFEISGLSFHVCERAWSWTPPVFSDFDFWLVLDGGGALRVNGKLHVLEPGLGFLLQPGDEVVGSKGPDALLTVFACHIQPKRPPGRNRRLSPQAITFRTNDVESFRRMGGDAVRAWQGTSAPAGGALAKTLVAGIVLRALLSPHEPAAAAAPSALRDLALEIQSEPGKDWSLAAMARHCSLSVPHFTRTFRRAFATSPRQFVIHQRIGRAIHLLRESLVPIKEIADSLGYTDHFFFHRQFRSLAGATPAEVRKGAATEIQE